MKPLPNEIIVDNFAGGGGASTGIELALGRSPDIAVNHSYEALTMHMANHPKATHYCEDVWQIDPVKVCAGRPVALAWFSPDCKHFSKAKGGKPVDKKVRGLAWVVVKWAKAVRPRVICLENVEEFQHWGPLLPNNMPCPLRKGLTFRRWKAQLENLGYEVDCRELRACDYGAPTIRKRLFVVARCDGQPIRWPKPTHGKGLLPYRTAAECIDWEIPCQSIFERTRPLAEATMRRIAAGIRRYVLEAADPFIVPLTHQGDARVYNIREPFRTITAANRGETALVSPTLIQTSWGERQGQSPRVPGLHKPLGTVMAGGGKHALVAAFLAKHYGGHTTPGWPLTKPFSTVTTQDHHALITSNLVKLYGTSTGQDVREPMPTITAGGQHIGEVRAFLLKYYGTDQDPRLEDPLHTITTKHRFGIVTVEGHDYQIVDIGMRMLTPRELFNAQSFPRDYVIAPEIDGEPLSQTAQIRMCGNSVPPEMAAALLRAQFPEPEQMRVAA